MSTIQWEKDVTGMAVPTLYPGEKSDNWEIPNSVSDEYHRLNSIIESKYSKEFLKICAFYNKMFPSLRTTTSQTPYNSIAFTVKDQERTDTGAGTNYNYLKAIVDQITSRLGTILFQPMLTSEDPNYEYVIYKDTVERVLRTFIRDDNFNRICLESFHNAAILGYSHVFIDPYTGRLVKAPDYTIGFFESQFNHNNITQMLYRDYSFPVTEVGYYLTECDDKQKTEVMESILGRDSVDFKMYFDCIAQEVYVTIGSKTLPAKKYPFDKVLMATFQWDTGFNRTHTTSEFDKLYPIQREINKIAAKIQQFVRLYKGPVPVFNSDIDLVVKQLSNGSGEVLVVDSGRPVDSLMTVINPTPLDSQLDAQIQAYKTTMFELSGIQNSSFDMEQMRSASAVIALDQMRDSVFQAQMSSMSQFIKDALHLYIQFYAEFPDFSPAAAVVDWRTVNNLMKNSYIDLKPVHLNDFTSDTNTIDTKPSDYIEMMSSQFLLKLLNNKATYDTIPYYLDPALVTKKVAETLAKFAALGLEIPMSIHKYLIRAYLEEIAAGQGEL